MDVILAGAFEFTHNVSCAFIYPHQVVRACIPTLTVHSSTYIGCWSFLCRYLAIILYLIVTSATMTPNPSRALKPKAVNFSHFGMRGFGLMLLTLVREERGGRVEAEGEEK